MFSYRLKYNGLNFSNFLNFLIKNNICIFNVEKVNNKEFDFSISLKDYKRYKKLNSVYNISIIKKGGFLSVLNYALKRSGIAVGLLMVLIFSIIISRFTLSINIVGANLYRQEIEKNIYDFGIELGQINKFDNEELEQYILEKNSKVSLVSVKKQGGTIIINVVENDANDEEKFEPFYSPYNMVIKEIELISGTLNIDKNSVVKKGDCLVQPYTISSNGERISVSAKANIVADVWFCGSETIYKENIIYEKTGNKKELKKINFKKISDIDIMSPYTNYMSETININIANNNILPIYLTKTIIYETKKITKIFDYEKEKNNCLEKSRQKAYDILPKNVTINETIQKVSELSDRYIFQTYLKSTMEINNET